MDDAVAELLSHCWDESFRKRAYDLARAMSDGCKLCGFKESSRLLRSMESLLALPVAATVGIQSSLSERLRDQMELLHDDVGKARA